MGNRWLASRDYSSAVSRMEFESREAVKTASRLLRVTKQISSDLSLIGFAPRHSTPASQTLE